MYIDGEAKESNKTDSSEDELDDFLCGEEVLDESEEEEWASSQKRTPPKPAPEIVIISSDEEEDQVPTTLHNATTMRAPLLTHSFRLMTMRPR